MIYQGFEISRYIFAVTLYYNIREAWNNL